MNQAAKKNDGIVPIYGKNYKTVALRIQEFRDAHPDYGIETQILSQADLVTVRAIITNESGRVLSTGCAEENRAFGKINQTSALENAETSAVGRALAFLGLGGTEIASADEVANAIAQQNVAADLAPLLHHNAVASELFSSIFTIKEALAEAQYSVAKEAWRELGSEEQKTLWLLPSQGGIFTEKEREEMTSENWKAAE